MKDLAVISNKLAKIDVEAIKGYIAKVSEISNLSPGAASLYLKDFIIAFDLASNALASAMVCEADAKAALEQIKGEAYMDRAAPYLTQNSMKESDAARKVYVDIDEEVVKAKEVLSIASSYVNLFRNKTTTFRYAYEAIKKIYYSNNNDMPFEGM